MESDQRYYWRRASEELYAAARAVTPAAQTRRRQLAESYLKRLRELATERQQDGEIRMLSPCAANDPLIEWPLRRDLAEPVLAPSRRPAEWPLAKVDA